MVTRENWDEYKGLGHFWDYVINATGSNNRRHPDYDQNVLLTKKAWVDFPARWWLQCSSIVAERDEEYGRQKRDAEHNHDLAFPHCHTIYRFGALVGQGQTKGPFYDLKHGRLYVHPDSTLPVLDVDDAVRLAWECRDMEGILNVAGKGRVRIGDIGNIMEPFPDLPLDSWDIDISRLESRCEVPLSSETARKYLSGNSVIPRET